VACRRDSAGPQRSGCRAQLPLDPKRRPASAAESKPFELALAEWEPFDEAMKKWPAAKILSVAANAPASGRIAAHIKTNKPSGSVSAAEPKPFELVLEDWVPFDEAMKSWPAAGIRPALSTASKSGVVAAPVESKQPLGSAGANEPKTFELALAGWEPLAEAMKGWPIAKDPPAPSKKALPETEAQPAEKISSIVLTAGSSRKSRKNRATNGFKALPEPLGAPASLRATGLAETPRRQGCRRFQ
jgi:hypothetical protein